MGTFNTPPGYDRDMSQIEVEERAADQLEKIWNEMTPWDKFEFLEDNMSKFLTEKLFTFVYSDEESLTKFMEQLNLTEEIKEELRKEVLGE